MRLAALKDLVWDLIRYRELPGAAIFLYGQKNPSRMERVYACRLPYSFWFFYLRFHCSSTWDQSRGLELFDLLGSRLQRVHRAGLSKFAAVFDRAARFWVALRSSEGPPSSYNFSLARSILS